MTDNNRNTSEHGLQYRSPEVKVVFVKAQNMFCQSNGNEPMSEVDYGNGGFE